MTAKDHYDLSESHVTLLSEELIGYHAYDYSTDRRTEYGDNHWNLSGTPNAEHGIRSFLNSLDKNIHSYSENGFFTAFNEPLKDMILSTGVSGVTDKVFVLSQTELGDGSTGTSTIGNVLPYFDIINLYGPKNEEELLERRISAMEGVADHYWTRSPSSAANDLVRRVSATGFIGNAHTANHGSYGVRPVINISTNAFVTSSKNLEGFYEIVTHRVIFEDYDGNVIHEQTVGHRSDAFAPADPEREGYTFTGWDADFTNVTEALTVAAMYEINEYNVTFEDWDGTLLKEETVEHGGDAVAPTDPEREGYTFTGWDTDFSNVTEDLSVKANYEINTYTLTLGVNEGGSTNPSDELLLNYKESTTIKAIPDTGYKFVKWVANAGIIDDVNSSETTFTMLLEDTIITAIFEPLALETVARPFWDGRSVIWEAVDYADGYLVILYKNGNEIFKEVGAELERRVRFVKLYIILTII